MSAVSNPVVTLDIIKRDAQTGLEDQRVLICGQKTSAGAAAAGLYRDAPRTDAEINELWGARSHVAQMLRAFRKINNVTNVDVIALADNGGGTAATGVLAISGTATAAKTIYVSIASSQTSRYEINVKVGDAAADVAGKVLAAAAADTSAPFTAALSTATLTFTAANKGTHANGWLLSVLDAYDRPGLVAGLTFTITAWGSGATNPVLTSLFDDVANIRYQHIVYPAGWTVSYLKSFIDARKNLDNDVKDGTGFQYITDTLSNLKSASLAINSSEVVLLSNKANDLAHWRGPHVPEMPDVITARFVAAASKRYEDQISISALVATNAPNDQFGGMDKAALPLFNTPLLNTRVPLNGSGFSETEQRELQNAGITIVGANRTNNAVIMGVVVTTWQNDDAGNTDDTWKYLEWRKTHGAIREYMVLNCRKQFAQARLTSGIAVAGYSMVNESVMRAFLYLLYDQLADMALTVKGRDARKYFEDALVVKIKPDRRSVELAADAPMVSQLGAITGSIKFSFTPGQAAA